MTDEKVFTPINPIGTQPILFMGADRELLMTSGLLSAVLIFTTQSMLSAVIGIGLWFLSAYFLRKMAKKDPQLRGVYMKHIKYKAFYASHSTPFVKTNRTYK